MEKSQKQIEDLIEEWHSGNFTIPLHEFLGLTWEEYCIYVEKGILPDAEDKS